MKLAILTAAIVTLAQVAMAAGPCAVQRKDCQSKNLTEGHGLWKCVAEEAQKAGNTACLTMLKSHKGAHGGAAPAAGAPAGEAPTAE
jgi:hypothetical protein